MVVTNLPVIKDIDTFIRSEFDYLIVGGGTAGLVVAARLTENPRVTVGVLEAGDAHIGDERIMTPASFSSLAGDACYDWNFRTAPQTKVSGISFAQPRGKCLGGSSAINYMVLARGQKSEYDDWGKLTGYGSWNWDSVWPFLLKHEAFHLQSFESSGSDVSPATDKRKLVKTSHGSVGPIKTSWPTWSPPIEDAWFQSCRQWSIDYSASPDPWSGDVLGIYTTLNTIDRSETSGTRSYSVSGYLLPNGNRPNLMVLPKSLVNKILFDDEGECPKAVGLNFSHHDRDYNIKVKKEIIISAGTFKTPQLLELSGIGDKKLLHNLQIPCIVANSYVGERLEDHANTCLSWEVKDEEFTLDWMSRETVVRSAMNEYINGKGGVLAQSLTNNGFLSIDEIANEDEKRHLRSALEAEYDVTPDRLAVEEREILASRIQQREIPNLQIAFIALGVDCSQQDNLDQFFIKGRNAISVMIALTNPFSRGSVHISSSDPALQPRIDPGYLQHPVDAVILAIGMRVANEIVNTPPLSNSVLQRLIPSPDTDLQSLAARERHISRYLSSLHHPIGTASLGRVVDEDLRVKGTHGLRVADASVIPLHISGNIVAGVYAIGEKVSDMIRVENSAK